MVRWRKHKLNVVFTAGNFRIILNSKERTLMSTTLIVGQTLPLSVQGLDQHGNPMPLPAGATVAWGDATPATGTLTAAADGLTASYLGVAVGDDTINIVVAAGGQTFQASLGVSVQPQPQVLTSVEIVAGTPS